MIQLLDLYSIYKTGGAFEKKIYRVKNCAQFYTTQGLKSMFACREGTSSTVSLKGHCHGNFAIFWSKPLKYLTKSLFFNMKLLIQHWEENTKVFLSEEQTIVIF